VLEISVLFTKLAQRHAHRVNYSINGHYYIMGYYIANRIYPKWSTFIKTISNPLGSKKKHFAVTQESTRKDIELVFRVLQARFAIVRQTIKNFNVCDLKEIMKACIIFHNMIIEDEQDEQDMLDFDYEQLDEIIPSQCHMVNQICLQILFVIIYVLEIEKLILNSNHTSSSTYGNYTVNHKSFG
jgi:hypothetical protein